MHSTPPTGEGYIWEIKFLPAGQESEDNPLFYYTTPAEVKETGFIIHAFNAPEQIEAYDTYDIEVDYLFDEGAYAVVTLVNSQTGEEAVRLKNFWLRANEQNDTADITVGQCPH